MTRLIRTLPLVAAALAAATAASAETHVTQRDLASLLVHCDKPVASITVGKFTCKAEACSDAPAAAGPGAGFAALAQFAAAANGMSVQHFPALGESMSSAMVTALRQTGCFAVQEREAMEEIQREAAIAGVQLKATPADYLVSGAVTSVNVSSKSSSFGGGMLPVVGALSRSTRNASVGLDVRLIDVRGASVRDSRSFSADSSRSNWGVGGLAYGGSGALFGTGHSTQSTELDSVVNEAVINAANYVAEDLAAAGITARPVPAAPAR
jgi:curli biogenesis system outer membrane secretion channel CsgG